ncbi:aldose 1-epimerase [Phyllobacterium ifriqiyense]|uniref:Aldose 1-epimerase n=1 Tax=Phyllobacterium ifriqiyense TaxID=314238 RepID=A0ABU0S6G4_9HYPH|nr:aldose 1-epimerase [Phyllobacterium ifriqiyense]MDQ0996347.1 aldose 1-epimerase [Phyllobacterium ifriqiyense]
MPILTLSEGNLEARISTSGGTVLGFWLLQNEKRTALLREAKDDTATALQSGCYPLVPFGNRVKGNKFTFVGEEFKLEPNTDWDPHYLHGEGWLSTWNIVDTSPRAVTLRFSHRSNDTPYVYEAEQKFCLEKGGLTLSMSVTNKGEHALPFGLGWHPYFPMTPETTLLAPAERFWTELDGWLPGEAAEIPGDLDFRQPRKLPHRWVNNGFENWSGYAQITWPERNIRLTLKADSLFRHAFIFVSDTTFDPDFQRDYFCFEPMSHLADGHHQKSLGDLQVLHPGETLSGEISLRPELIG